MANEGQIRGQDLIHEDVFAKLAQLDQGLARIISRLNEIQQAGQRSSSNTALAGVSRQSLDLNNEANVLLREQKKLEDNLIRTRARSKLSTEATARALAKQKFEQQQQNKEVKRAVILASDYAGAYQKLSTQLLVAKDRLKDMLVVTKGQYTPAVREQQKEVDRLAQKIKIADNAAGDFQRNVGNYPSALRPVVGIVRQLVGAFGLVEGLRIGARFIADAVRLAREAKGVQFAFENIGDSGVEAFERIKRSTRGLLADLEIKQAIVEFDNFRLNAEQLDTVLEFVTLRAVQTGKSFEYLRSSAIEAITKESVLRADNLGLSQKALNVELDKGVDFLTAFTNIAQREIARSGDALDNATNDAQKFNAEMNNLSVSVGSIVESFKGFSFVLTPLRLLSQQFGQINRAIEARLSLGQQLLVITRTSTLEGRIRNEAILREAEARIRNEKAIRAEINALVALRGVYGPLTEAKQKEVDSDEDRNRFSLEYVETINDLNDKIAAQNTLLGNADKTDTKRIRAIQAKIKALEDERDAVLGIIETEEKRIKTQDKSIQFYQDTINNLKELQSKTAKNTEEFNQFQRAIDEAEGALLSIQGAFDAPNIVVKPGKLNLSEVEIIGADDGAIFQEIDDFLNTEGIEQGMQTLAERLGVNQSDLIDEFENNYERDYQNFLKYTDLKIEAAQFEKETRLEIASEIGAGIADIGTALFDAAEDRADREVERQNEVLDSIINSKNATEEQIEIAQKKREENEKKRQKEREKRQRAEFLLNQAAQVAEVFISDALARIRAVAQSRLLPPIAAEAYLASIQGLISTQTGISLATILAQTLPRFFFQGKSPLDPYEGPGIWGERRREVKIGSDGQVEVSPNKATPLFVKRDDIILKSVPDFHSQMQNPNSETFRRVTRTLIRDTKERTQIVSPQGYNGYGVESAIKKGFKGIRHDIKIINKWPEERLRRF